MRTELQDLEPDEQIVPGVNSAGTTETREGKKHVNYAHKSNYTMVHGFCYTMQIFRKPLNYNYLRWLHNSDKKVTGERGISSKTREK